VKLSFTTGGAKVSNNTGTIQKPMMNLQNKQSEVKKTYTTLISDAYVFFAFFFAFFFAKMNSFFAFLQKALNINHI
jgi:ABC-type phosphate/phosphonate transport system permease subunit